MCHMDNSRIREVSLKDLWDLLVRRFAVIMLVMAMTTGAATVLGKRMYVPMYSSTATLYILRQSEHDSASDTANDFSLALKVVNDCAYMLKSHTVLEELISQLHLDLSCRELYSRITATNPPDTRILEITVTMESAEAAKETVDALCRIGSGFITRAMGFEQLNLLEWGTLEQEPSNQVGWMTWGMVGAAAGVLTYCAFLLQFLLDDRIRAGDDLERRLGVRVLGVIPYGASQCGAGACGPYAAIVGDGKSKKG